MNESHDKDEILTRIERLEKAMSDVRMLLVFIVSLLLLGLSEVSVVVGYVAALVLLVVSVFSVGFAIWWLCRTVITLRERSLARTNGSAPSAAAASGTAEQGHGDN